MKVQWIATALLLFALASGQPPMPTPDQVAWLDREVGALFQFNIGEYGTVSVCLCIIRPLSTLHVKRLRVLPSDH